MAQSRQVFFAFSGVLKMLTIVNIEHTFLLQHFSTRENDCIRAVFAVVGVLEKLSVILFYSYTFLPNFSTPTTPRKGYLLLVSKSAVGQCASNINLPALF